MGGGKKKKKAAYSSGKKKEGPSGHPYGRGRSESNLFLQRGREEEVFFFTEEGGRPIPKRVVLLSLWKKRKGKGRAFYIHKKKKEGTSRMRVFPGEKKKGEGPASSPEKGSRERGTLFRIAGRKTSLPFLPREERYGKVYLI